MKGQLSHTVGCTTGVRFQTVTVLLLFATTCGLSLITLLVTDTVPRSVNLTTHHHLVSKLRMRGALPALPNSL
jgi:hypothetical protein